MNGTVIIVDGGRLDIPAGTTIKIREGFSSYLLVAQGGKLYANGTVDRPTVFTANTTGPVSEYWGGVIINGKAPISGSRTDKSGTALAEINDDYRYGGGIADDNSGSLAYAKVCYADVRSAAGIEYNGLTLSSVDSETRVENIYVPESADGAIEFFGRTVSATNLLAVNPDDDMFDFTQGYYGTLENCYGVWEGDYANTEADPHDIEADGNMDGLYPGHLHQSDFKVEDMTIVNNVANTTDNVDRIQDVTRIHRGAKTIIANALARDTGDAVDPVDMKDSKGVGNIESNINIASILSLTGLKQNGELNTLVELAGSTGAGASLFGWTDYNLSASQ